MVATGVAGDGLTALGAEAAAQCFGGVAEAVGGGVLGDGRQLHIGRRRGDGEQACARGVTGRVGQSSALG